jgi:ribosomal protein L12E/L44/L45/RPP1/RPP2
MGFNAAKLAFSVNLPVSTADLRQALEAAGVALDNDSLFRARYEVANLLNRNLDRLLAEAAHNVKKSKEA